jgi:hypothetical protein
MLVSDQYRFIFVHIPKVAGTSIQQGLRESIYNNWELGNWEIEWFLRRINSYLIPLSKNKICLGNPLYNETHNSLKNPLYNKPINENLPEKAHAKAIEIRAMLGAEKYDNYFKFAFVRNPWSLVLSMYRYGNRKKQPTNNPSLKTARKLTFEEYVESFIARHPTLQLQKAWVTNESGNISVDYIGKFETLQEDYNKILEKIGLPPRNLPGLNIDPSKIAIAYRNSYNSKTQSIIYERYKDDIDLFGYTF